MCKPQISQERKVALGLIGLAVGSLLSAHEKEEEENKVRDKNKDKHKDRDKEKRKYKEKKEEVQKDIEVQKDLEDIERV